MQKHLVRLLALAAFAVCSSANAAVITFLANLTVSQEAGANTPNAPGGPFPLTTSTGAPRPTPFGTAVFVLNDAIPQLTMTATIFNLDLGAHTGGAPQTADPNDDLTRMHIHMPAPPGQTAAIEWPIFESNLDANPLNTDDDDLVITPFAVGVGGTISAVWDADEPGAFPDFTALAVSRLVAGLAYLNGHTVQFPGGEIRGQIVPEPGTLGLIALALAGLYCARRGSRNSRARRRQ